MKILLFLVITVGFLLALLLAALLKACAAYDEEMRKHGRWDDRP